MKGKRSFDYRALIALDAVIKSYNRGCRNGSASEALAE